MKIALNLSDDGRILSVTFDRFAPPEQPRVENLPDGDITEYRYVDGEYIHEPLPETELPEEKPTVEERVSALEVTTDDIILMMAELIGG